MRAAILVAVVLVGVVAGYATVSTTPGAEAAGPCGTSHDAMDAEEFAFLELFQQWRDANLENSSQLTPSGPLNAAAAWFAEYVAGGGQTNGHSDNHGRDYFDRALDCGWPLEWGMGEGGAHVTTAQQAANAIPHSSVGPFEAPDNPAYPPLKCIGVGRVTVGSTTVWIVLIAQFPATQECYQAQTQPITGDDPVPTATPTTSPTASPTPSPTPIPTPVSWQSWVPGLRAN